MDGTKPTGLNRRKFLRRTAGTAIAAAGFSFAGLRQAVADSRKTGKPVLTARSLEDHIPAPTSPEFQQHISEAKSDLTGYLKKNFEISKSKWERLARLSSEERTKLKDALDTASQKKLKIRIEEVPSTAKFSLQPQVQGDSLIIRVGGQ